ncbi:retinoblastoma-like protein 2 isoform X2 [Sinocyclocheilus rhinocerous]|uniref:retinoblastoma-like protein 2 isoform X1 n=1 Tax=Sinocyclocheilus rhinocerous TaxID=307959 RepID=UPI0007B88495|nr:PREDICTED: retinoblastoma-like protein 2 isoform X1 [Sinocyclocheilus rhinocerous]XP_016388199.1 PREDICTED: retinoblastoma-like protein 2 isoform X2 [Sinocyclocheilus rhinocerous]
MNEEEDTLVKTRHEFEDLCRALNMDEEASNGAWRSYENISKNYTLEGSELHWLACALYVACRSSVPTIGKGTAEGNYVSLTRILRSSQQSLIEFFNKMKKWQDMASLPKEFQQSTEKLERNFTVTSVIFKKYVPLFKDIFKAPTDELPRAHRGRKQRRHPCTVTEVFNFCWILFIHAKGNFPMISDDLVNSYHLLLCALDLVYCNALLCSSRKDLLNPAFKGLPEDFNSKDYKPGPGSLCFIEKLCELHDGLVLEAKGAKEHFWKPFIKKLFERKVLKGKEDTLTGFLEPVNFGDSLASLNRVYEEHVLSSGSLDERIFLGEAAREDIGTPGPCLCEGIESQERPTNPLQNSMTASALKVSTPLTGRRYVPESSVGTPVSMAMQSVGRLHTLLTGFKYRPSMRLRDIFRSGVRDPSESIAARLKEMSEIFLQNYEGTGEENKSLARDVAVKYFCLAEALYYKSLEVIINQEKKRLGDMDLSRILEQDIFHRSLIVCCLEIIIFSYRPPGEFPRVLQIFDLPAYHFYKVIEVLVRAEEGLFREVVKHLNHVEEQVLESLAWKGNSPLWESIREAKNCVPACQEVMPPQHLEDSSGSNTHTPNKSEFSSKIAGAVKGVSPSPTSLHDRYNSPPTGTACRRLFIDGDSTSETAQRVKVAQPSLVSPIPAGQTVVTMATATVTANNGQTVTIPVQGIANENGGITFIPVQVSVTGQSGGALPTLSAQALTGTLTAQQLTVTPTGTVQNNPSPAKPDRKSPQQGTPTKRAQKTGSLCLFFRKVYHLASVRLRDLCAKLDISTDLRRKIWTCFEYSLVHCTDLMMDRHLDQLLMCAIYVMTKVTKEDKSFQNIMKCYRSQPQASSSVYRSVLISGRKRRHSGNSENTHRQCSPTEGGQEQASGESSPVSMRSNSTLPIPQPSSTPSTPTRAPGVPQEQEEERGDLICFYNNVYIKQIKQFALRYSSNSPKNGAEAPPLCPYPSVRIGSPRRVLLSHNHSIYISPHKTGSPITPRDRIFYYVSSSPSNRLREINSMIRTGETPTKKRSIALEEEQQSPAKRLCQENQTALLRRLQDVANDRSSSH